MVNFSTSALVIITLFTCSLPFSVGFKAHICPVIARQPNLLTGTSKQISQQTARTSATLFGRSRTITNDNIFELYEDETGECDDMDSTFVLTTPGGKTKSASQNE